MKPRGEFKALRRLARTKKRGKKPPWPSKIMPDAATSDNIEMYPYPGKYLTFDDSIDMVRVKRGPS